MLCNMPDGTTYPHSSEKVQMLPRRQMFEQDVVLRTDASHASNHGHVVGVAAQNNDTILINNINLRFHHQHPLSTE